MTPPAQRPAELSSLPSFGRYEPAFRIASGGMAEVYGARARGDSGFKKWVALKRMLPHLSEEERFVEMFLDEARIAANIHSPHVVSTLDLGRASDGSVFLVMDLVIGATLSTLLRAATRAQSRLPVGVAVEIVAQAAMGLHDAHDAKTSEGVPLEIVHRDVSPQNILVGIDGRTRIMDFGVARATMRETRTRTGEVKGKLSYFSPEQAGMGDLDRRSDVFSLGVVAWESLAGRRLFAAENPLAILSSLTSMEIPDLHEMMPDRIPPELAAAVAHALERDRDARTPTAAAFAEELRRAAARADLTVRSELIAGSVREFGAQIVEQLESGIRTLPTGELAATGHVANIDVVHGAPVDSGTVLRRDADRTAETRRLVIGDLEPDVANPVRAPSWRGPVVLVAVGLSVLGAAFFVWPSAVPTPSDAEPRAAVGAPGAAAEPPAREPTAEAPTAEAPIALPAPEPLAPETTVAAETLTEEPDDPTEEPAAERSVRRTRRRATRAGAEPTTAETPAAPHEPASEAAPPTETPRTGGMRGVDSFDRSIGL